MFIIFIFCYCFRERYIIYVELVSFEEIFFGIFGKKDFFFIIGFCYMRFGVVVVICYQKGDQYEVQDNILGGKDIKKLSLDVIF